MKQYVAIVKVAVDRVGKFKAFDTLAEAEAHVVEYGGFVFDNSDQIEIHDMKISGTTVTNEPIVEPITNANVNAELTRRMATFTYEGYDFQFDADAESNIGNMAALARFSAAGGMDIATADWLGTGEAFAWRAKDNTFVLMPLGRMISFGDAAVVHKLSHLKAAWTLKDTDPIPQDYADDKYWP